MRPGGLAWRHALALVALLLPAALAGCTLDASVGPARVLPLPHAVVDPADEPLALPPVRLAPVAANLSMPLLATHAGDGSGRLFVVEQSGSIRIVAADGTLRAFPFLSGLPDFWVGGERGLLGLAFHPGYAENGRFFVSYTTDGEDMQSLLVEYRVHADDPHRANASTARVVLAVDQPRGSHNGGHLAFDPYGYLVMSLGDGGGHGDPDGHGQDPTTLLGSLVRLDVDAIGERAYGIPPDNPFPDGRDGAPEVWVHGLRNPWRFSFDHATGDLWIGDVGQLEREEVNRLPLAEAAGANLGWNALEGTAVYDVNRTAPDAVAPLLEYPHTDGTCAVTGGHVYRGKALSDLVGTYVFGDYCRGTIWGARVVDGAWHVGVLLETSHFISSFGEDEDGELYVVDHRGSVLRIVPEE